MTKYDLSFNGYLLEEDVSTLSNSPGVYIVYRCRYKKDDGVHLEEIIYIGQAQDLNKCLNPHEKTEQFKNELKEGEQLCFSYVELDKNDLDKVENAMIFVQNPRLNDPSKYKYNYETPVHFMLRGRCSLMKYLNFTIND